MNNYDYYGYVENGMELYHHGIMGMHWGIRRFQPYRKGEYVHGGKEVGEAARRNKHQDKLDILREKTELRRAKNELASEEHKSKLEEAQSKLDVATAKAALKNVDNNPNAVGINGKGNQGQNYGPPVPADPKREQLKQNIIRSGDPKLVRQYERMLSNDEYRQATERVRQREQLQKDIKDRRFDKFINAGERITNTVRMVGNMADTVKDSYNKVATVRNFLAGDDKSKHWKKIEAPKTPEQQQKIAAARKAREDIRTQYGIDPVTGARAKAIYDPQGRFVRYTTTMEEATGRFVLNDPTAPPGSNREVIDTTSPANNAIGPTAPGVPDRRYTIR